MNDDSTTPPPPSIISINVGEPREVDWHGERILTAIFKAPVDGPVVVGDVNLAGDRQADLRFHGGRNKAVYAYPSEHYAFWRREVPTLEDGWGLFGENLTTAGLLEDALHLDDVLRIGTAELEVSQPRMPCQKLGVRHGDPQMVRRFQAAKRSGFYLRIKTPGTIRAGDPIEVVRSAPEAPTIQDLVEWQSPPVDREGVARALTHDLDPEWRERMEQRLAEARPD